MSERVLLATFDNDADLLAATAAARARGLRIIDAFTPYSVHGLDRAMGLASSRLTWFCFICGMLGALGMLWFQHETAAVWWPIDVGGKPWDSLPSDVPVAFEAAVLLAGFGSVFALFAVCRLFPGKKPTNVLPRTTDDRFVLVVDEADSSFDLPFVRQMLREYNVIDVEERVSVGGTFI